MSEPVVDVEQGELSAGMRPFPAGDDAGGFWPVVVDQLGELGHPGAVADAAVGLHRRDPVLFLG